MLRDFVREGRTTVQNSEDSEVCSTAYCRSEVVEPDYIAERCIQEASCVRLKLHEGLRYTWRPCQRNKIRDTPPAFLS
jgi:hypothetical protein